MNISQKMISTLTATMLLSACCTTSSDSVKSDIYGTRPGPVFQPMKMSTRDLNVLSDAAEEVVKIVNDPKFRDGLNTQSWRAGCGTNTLLVSGSDIINDLQNNTLQTTLRKKNSRGAKATTTFTRFPATGAVRASMRIDPDRFNDWHKGPQYKANMINTLLHETLHLVPSATAYDMSNTTDYFQKYTDQGHNTNGCNDPEIASYVIGNLAEKIWLENNTE